MRARQSRPMSNHKLEAISSLMDHCVGSLEASLEPQYSQPVLLKPAVRADTILQTLAAADGTPFHIKNRVCINKRSEQYSTFVCSWPGCKVSTKIVFEDKLIDFS